MYMTTPRYLAHAYAEQLLHDLRLTQRSAAVLHHATGSIEAAKAETRLALAIEDITDLAAQLAPAQHADAYTAALAQAEDSLRSFTPEA